MTETANEYYTKYTRGIPPEDLQQWERAIDNAEIHRMTDRTVMDIIGATQPSSAMPNHTPDRAISRGDVTEWIELALMLEEKQ
jgi:hypothetical protein